MDPITVEISLEDLDVIRAALNTGYHHSSVLDLGEQYRKLDARTRPSKMTQAFKNALTLTMAYIAQATAEPEEEDDEREE